MEEVILSNRIENRSQSKKAKNEKSNQGSRLYS